MKNYFSSSFKLGILGGGQLGKMLLTETGRLDIHTAVMDLDETAPCATKADTFVKGDIRNYADVLEFGRTVDHLTIEIEHVNVDALQKLAEEGVNVSPSPKIIWIIQDKSLQKQFYDQKKIPTVPYELYENLEELRKMELTFPCVQKAALEGYDGRGVNILRSAKDIEKVPEGAGFIEEYIENKTELAVIVARNESGEVKCYPAVEMEFHPTANLVEYISCPAKVSHEVHLKAEFVAKKVAEAFELTGVLAVELFVTEDEKILVNESAPRPHNSGHQTIEGNFTSQYAQHLRGILDMPLGSTQMLAPSVMVNILGHPKHAGPPKFLGLDKVLAMEGVYVHIYGKKKTKPFRKMGHVTIVGATVEEAKEKAIFVKENLKVRP